MNQSKIKPRPRGRNAYRKFVKFATRWRDNDQYGHMNNAVYYELFDSAVNKFLIESGILEIAGDKTVFLVASSRCDYFAEVAYPCDVEIGVSICKIGTSSIAYELGLFVAGEEKTAAAGMFVHVNVCAVDQRPCVIDDLTRAKCADLFINPEKS